MDSLKSTQWRQLNLKKITQLTHEDHGTWRVSYLDEINWHFSKTKFKNALMIKIIVNCKTSVTIQGNIKMLRMAYVV